MPENFTPAKVKMKEEFLHFIWQNRLYGHQTLVTKKGTLLEVIKTGDLNTDSGADFFNARIKLGSLVFAGNIEIHVKSSDWLKHGHQQDSAYDNIILHVVYEHDTDILQNETHHVDVLELKSLISDEVIQTYSRFQSEDKKLPCGYAMANVSSTLAVTWLNRMAVERMEKKMDDIEKRFEQFNGDFLQTYFALLLRAFGFKTNSLPFELIASYLPIQTVMKHIGSRLQLEAILLGTAGMLEEDFKDKYLKDLQDEYSFLKDKFKLSQLNKDIFKYSRLRPGNFPGLRLAQLAQLLCNKPEMFLNVERLIPPDELRVQLSFDVCDYWKHHYKPDGKAVSKEMRLGKSSIESVMINAFSYFYFFYGKKLNKPTFQDYALDILDNVSFEKNHKTNSFSALKGCGYSALESQGMLHLYDHYCVKRRCLNCAIAAAVFKNEA